MIITNGLNEFYVNGKVTIMTVNYKGEKQLFYIDTDDLERVKRFKWVYTPIGEYAWSNELDTSLHRFILGVTDSNVVVDHASRNTHDNTKSNLRTATKLQNRFNASGIGKSGVKGIKWRADRSKWYTDIRVDGVKQGKSFSSFIDAVNYRNEIYKKYQGEYAMIEEYFELYRTNNEYEVIMLETEGFHFVDYSDGVYTYILSKQLKEFVDNDTTFTYNDIEDTQERVM